MDTSPALACRTIILLGVAVTITQILANSSRPYRFFRACAPGTNLEIPTPLSSPQTQANSPHQAPPRSPDPTPRQMRDTASVWERTLPHAPLISTNATHDTESLVYQVVALLAFKGQECQTCTTMGNLYEPGADSDHGERRENGGFHSRPVLCLLRSTLFP